MITIIGRGHSGTRAISHTLSASGVFMGQPLNKSGDLLPPEAMYDACRVLARYVRWQGGLTWDFSRLHTMEIPTEFSGLIETYLASVLASPAGHKGWKIPETTLVFPWIVRLFPDIKYIFWIRNPRDCVAGRHKTDDLADFGIPYPVTADTRLRRAISWLYQYQLVKATPKPKHWLAVRFEDFVLRQDVVLEKLSRYLNLPMAKIEVRPDSVGRWQTDEAVNCFTFFEPAMREHGYDIS